MFNIIKSGYNSEIGKHYIKIQNQQNNDINTLADNLTEQQAKRIYNEMINSGMWLA